MLWSSHIRGVNNLRPGCAYRASAPMPSARENRGGPPCDAVTVNRRWKQAKGHVMDSFAEQQEKLETPSDSPEVA